MDSNFLELEKPQALETCSQKKKTLKPFILLIFHRALAVLLLGVFLSSPNWIPDFLVSVHHFLFVALPNAWATILELKFLFIVCNIIIAVLIGPSMLLGSSSLEMAPDVYDEYVERTRSMRELAGGDGKKAMKDEYPLVVETYRTNLNGEDEIVRKVVKEAEGNEECRDHVQEEKEKYDQEEGWDGEYMNLFPDEDGEEDIKEDGGAGWQLDELNQRIEDFIARFKEQRRLEGRMLLCIESAA